MNWDKEDRKIGLTVSLQLLIIVIISYLLACLLNPYYRLDHDELYWLASTIVQAFGALIAIIVVIGLHYFEKIGNEYKEISKELNKRVRHEGKTIKKEDEDFLKYFKSIIEKNKEKTISVRKRLLAIMTVIFFLIMFSLGVLVFNKSITTISSLTGNWSLIYLSSLLVLSSLFCLYLLFKEIYNLFT